MSQLIYTIILALTQTFLRTGRIGEIDPFCWKGDFLNTFGNGIREKAALFILNI